MRSNSKWCFYYQGGCFRQWLKKAELIKSSIRTEPKLYLLFVHVCLGHYHIIVWSLGLSLNVLFCESWRKKHYSYHPPPSNTTYIMFFNSLFAYATNQAWTMIFSQFLPLCGAGKQPTTFLGLYLSPTPLVAAFAFAQWLLHRPCDDLGRPVS